MKNKGVSATHPDYDKALPVWTRCNDAAEGEQAVHAAGATYLPYLEGETDKSYLARKARTPFYNATWRTISGLKGMIFRSDPVKELPAAIEPYLDDIDMAGAPMDVFAQQLTEEVLTIGRAFVLVDHPATPTDGLTVAEAERIGLRPMLKMYRAVDLINWKCARIAGVMQLSMAVLVEQVTMPGDDEYEHASETIYRVLDIFNNVYRQRLYKIVDGNDVQIGGDVFPLMNGKPLGYIPGVVFGVDRLSVDVTTPPLLDLINMNFKHYTVSSDYEHGCHFSGLPTLFVFGLTPDPLNKLYIGGPSANCIPNPSGRAEYAEVQGGFAALQHNLESKESQMAVLGARMLEQQKKSVESAETQEQRVVGETSQLAAMAKLISQGLEKCLTIFAEWAGAVSEIKYRLNTDYVSHKLTAQEVTALVASWQGGAISQQVLFENLQRGELIDPATTFEEEQERIKSQGAIGMTPVEPIDDEDADPTPLVQDMTGVIAAIQAIPAPVVNVAAPVINVPPAVINMPEQAAPQITVNSPPVTVTPGSITVINSDSAKDIKLNYDDAGNITGGSVKPTALN